MKQPIKKMLSLLLAICLLLSLLPAALAADSGNYTVTYELNDPTGAYLEQKNPQPLVLQYQAGQKVTVEPAISNNYVIWYNGLICNAKSGFVFKGWNTKADGSGQSYQEGNVLADSISGSMTLYAIWSKTATLQITKSIVLPEGATNDVMLPDYFTYILNGQAANNAYVYAERDETAEEPTWSFTTDNLQGNRLIPETDLTMREEFGSDTAYVDMDYELEKVEYYVNGSSTPIVWNRAQGKADVKVPLNAGTTTVRVVNTYKKSDMDGQATGFSFQHRITQSDTADWSQSGTVHRATTQSPTVDYQFSADLNKLVLTQAGEENAAGLGLAPGQSIWNVFQTAAAEKINGMQLALILRISKEDWKEPTKADFTSLSLSHPMFELATDDPAHPEDCVELDEIKETGEYEIYIVINLKEDAQWNADVPDTLSVSGVTLQLSTPLTEDDTNRTPRMVETTLSLYGLVLLGNGGMISSLSDAGQTFLPGRGYLTIASEPITDTIGLYWKHLPDTYYLSVYKVDGQTEAPLEGAEFGLFQGQQQIAAATSGEDGYVSFSITEETYGTLNDTLTLRELAAPDGYALSDTVYPVQLEELVKNEPRVAVQQARTVRNYEKSAPPDLNGKDHVAYVCGYPDGTVRPMGTLTRAETATMLYQLLTEKRRNEIHATDNSFTDVAVGAWYNEAISTMAKGGYLSGYLDGTFRPDQPITRAELTAMLIRFIGVKQNQCSFSDVPSSHWAYDCIATATQAGWISGYPDGTFRPDQKIDRASAVAIINRVLDRGISEESTLPQLADWPDNEPSAWYYYEILEASHTHTYTGTRPAENWTQVG